MNLIRGGYASPASLFAAGEQGAWYNPSDLTTLFQDNLGATPVTAPGQTVGLMLDKSQGLVLGSELVTNGDFSQGSTGWSGSGAGGWVISGGVATHTAGTYGTLSTTATDATTAGKSYLLTFDFAGTGALNVYSRNALIALVSGTGSKRFIFTAAATSGPTLNFEDQTFNGTIDNISVKLLAGNHATQATSTQRPLYQIDGTGRPYLAFDGVDDCMVTNTITPAIDKVQVFAGVRKLSDAASGMLVELGDGTSQPGTFGFRFPSLTLAGATFSSRGTSSANATTGGIPAPSTNVLTGLGDIVAPSSILRSNGIQVGIDTATQGTGNFLAYPIYIGRRAGISNPFNGRLYSLIMRFGANLTTGQITSTESWVNGKTGAY